MPSTTKENIMNYCKEDGIQCKDSSANKPNFEWALDVQKLLVYTQKKFPHRIYIQSHIVFGELAKLLDTPAKKNNLMIQLKDMALVNNFNLDFIFDDKNNITGILCYLVHYNSSIKKADFLPMQLRVTNIQDILYNKLTGLLGTETAKLKAQQQSETKENPAIG
ncbi:hypothetical protein [Nitrosopumilus sp. S6]